MLLSFHIKFETTARLLLSVTGVEGSDTTGGAIRYRSWWYNLLNSLYITVIENQFSAVENFKM